MTGKKRKDVPGKTVSAYCKKNIIALNIVSGWRGGRTRAGFIEVANLLAAGESWLAGGG